MLSQSSTLNLKKIKFIFAELINNLDDSLMINSGV